MGISALLRRLFCARQSAALLPAKGAVCGGCCSGPKDSTGCEGCCKAASPTGCGECSGGAAALPDGGPTLRQAEEGRVYRVRGIATDDPELDAFLFTLGCFAGEPVTVVARHGGGCVVALRDGRYNIDDRLAGAILI